MVMDDATRIAWGFPPMPVPPPRREAIGGIPVTRPERKQKTAPQPHRTQTDYLSYDGWHVYIQVRDRQTVITVRSQKHQPGVAGTTSATNLVHRCQAHSQVAAWVKFLAWANAHPSGVSNDQNDDGGGGFGGPVPPGPQPSSWDAWSVDDDGNAAPSDWQFVSDSDRVRYRQLRMIEARSLLNAYDIRSRSQLRNHFARLALQHHPDHGGDESKWVRMQGAYSYLKQALVDELPGRTTDD